MARRKISRRSERGAALIELAIGGVLFFTLVFATIEFCRLLWTHNALVDATRQGARYAAVSAQNANNVKNVVVYGDPNPAVSAQPVIYGLTTSNVQVTYTNFGVKLGRVTVSITGYSFVFSIPLVGGSVTLPDYETTLTAEAAGFIPPDI